MSIFKEPIVFVDIETTGGSYRTSQIIEFAAFRVEEDQIVDEFHSLINPGTNIPRFITNITGIRDVDVANQPYFTDIAGNMQAILKGAVFAAHNVRFDLSFVKRQLELCSDTRFNPRLFCTVRLSRALYSGMQGHSLEKIIKRHELKVDARHRAYDDARVLWDFCKLAHAEHGEEIFTAAVKKQMKSRTMPPNLDEAHVERLDDSPGVYIFQDEEGQPIYIGKSIGVKSRVKSHFSESTKITKEMKLSQGVHGLKVITTASELEALLLESQLVKELLPLYNKQLRRTKQQIILEKTADENGYARVAIVSANLSDFDDISRAYGVYATQRKAKEALLRHQHIFSICPKMLGLEKGKGACFQYHLGRCQGACIGKESADTHNKRLGVALAHSKLDSWPYESAVIIKDSAKSGIVVDRWCVVGKAVFAPSGLKVEKVKKLFDLDTYKILRSFVFSKKSKVKIMPYTS